MTESEIHIEELLGFMKTEGASDLHLRVPSPPVLRIDGVLKPQVDLPEMTPDIVRQVFNHITTEEQQEMFYRDLELDFAYSVPNVARFRVNVMLQRGTMSIAFRRVPFEIPTIDGLELPQVCKSLSLKPRGLILVTGPTGSGKSTTLASMIDYLNEREGRNIITIENPIEYLHHNKKSIIAQRDLGDDTHSFNTALVHALRHDPDVILVGEMRDLETIGTAITAAETGHLVLGTLHTVDAVQTVDRMIDVFPPIHQHQIRLQVALVLEAVLSQTLLPRAEGKGRIAAFETLIAVPAVRNLIRTSKTFELPSIIQLGARDHMQTLNQSLAYLVRSGEVAIEEALLKSSEPGQLKKLIKGY
jgi:twitching motility protein PilT